MLLLHGSGAWLRDAAGRAMLLRGVNAGGSSKLPATPAGATHLPASLDASQPVSFVGRPFPLDEAHEHLGRLRHWGFNVLRLLTTWEAIEHAGPGRYDEAYLDWFAELVALAGDYGFYVFVDPHQDAWGRWSGGDGAPHWTYTACGLDPAHFDAAEAAITMQRRLPNGYGRMIWPANYSRFAASTMLTLFFGGSDFAPHFQIAGEPAQEYLQRHFVAAICEVARRLRGMPHVLGYGAFNEPNNGYIGRRLDELPRVPFPGPRCTPYDGMLLAAGLPRRAAVYGSVALSQTPIGVRLLNPQGARVWHSGASDIWRDAGVWRVEGSAPRLLRPDHFTSANGQPAHFATGYLKPFIARFAGAMRQQHPGALIFLESEPLQPEGLPWNEGDPAGVVNASHWYDAITLFAKRPALRASVDVYASRPVFGARQVRAMFERQIGLLRQHSAQIMGNCPTLIGEFGLPYDLNNGAAFRTGDWSAHERLLGLYYDALDANLVSATQWNYTTDNSNRWGDGWNGEDLSIFSRDQQHNPADPDSGGRATAGFCRPYARRVAGTPTAMRFDRETHTFELTYTSDPTIAAPSEIYVPCLHYPGGYAVSLSSGRAARDEANQLLHVYDAEGGEQRITIRE